MGEPLLGTGLAADDPCAAYAALLDVLTAGSNGLPVDSITEVSVLDPYCYRAN